MNQVARLAIILLGGYLAATLLIAVAQTTVQQAATQLSIGDVSVAISIVLIAALVGTAFALLPLVLLVRRSQDIADRLYPDETPQAPISQEGALIVGCTLLAILFFFQGIVSLVSGGFFFIGSPFPGALSSHAYPMLGGGTASVGVGALLYRYAGQRSRSGSAT